MSASSFLDEADRASKTRSRASKTRSRASKTRSRASKTRSRASKTRSRASKTRSRASKTRSRASKTRSRASKTRSRASKTRSRASKTRSRASKTRSRASKTRSRSSKTRKEREIKNIGQMNYLKCFTVGLFAALLIFACSNGAAKRNEYNIADSKSYEASLFRQNCAICHGQEANGKEMNGVLIPSLRYGEAETLTEEQVYLQIKEGKLPMPAFKNQLTEEEIKRMVKFVRRDLQGKSESGN